MSKRRIGFGIALVIIVAIVLGGGHHTKSVKPVSYKGTYIALGDSVAAGVGLKDFSDSSACNRTNEAYPDLVAAKLDYKLTSLACSGATLPAGILGSQDVNDLAETPQLKALFALPKPKLITITIGANDAAWTTIITKCYTGVCGSAEDTAGVNARLQTVTTNLSSALSQIRQHYTDGPPKVVVTGYHQVFPTTVAAGCTDLTGIDAPELAWGRQQQASINDTLSSVVKNFSFVVFAPVNFSGHELCTSDSWVQGLDDSEPYHPTDVGQKQFATAIEKALE